MDAKHFPVLFRLLLSQIPLNLPKCKFILWEIFLSLPQTFSSIHQDIAAFRAPYACNEASIDT